MLLNIIISLLLISTPQAQATTGEALFNKKCAACHATGPAPSLKDFKNRETIANTVPNTPGNLIKWLKNPQAVKPDTIMPNLSLTNEEIVFIINYLQTI